MTKSSPGLTKEQRAARRREYMKEYMRRFRREHPERDHAYRVAGALNFLRREGITLPCVEKDGESE